MALSFWTLPQFARRTVLLAAVLQLLLGVPSRAAQSGCLDAVSGFLGLGNATSQLPLPWVRAGQESFQMSTDPRHPGKFIKTASLRTPGASEVYHVERIEQRPDGFHVFVIRHHGNGVLEPVQELTPQQLGYPWEYSKTAEARYRAKFCAADVCVPSAVGAPSPPVSRDPDLFTRIPGSPVTGAYYQNAIEAVEFFEQWVASHRGRALNPSEFSRMSARMHSISALGRKGNRPYKTSGYSTDAIQAGSPWGGVKTLRSRRPAADAYAYEISKLIQQKQNIAPGYVGIPGFSPELNPLNAAAMHHYPERQYLAVYFARATQLLGEIINGSSRSDVALAQITEYYYVMVNARPYQQINNSLFMNQTNELLRMHGFSGVSHGYLDHLAHRLNFAQFKEAFKLQLAKELPAPGAFNIEIK